ncbi:MAG: hypothetical protein GXO70_07260 [Acidobacteria bacterium]|nr:hypothetical protein [Acidobacteriota bacterium]
MNDLKRNASIPALNALDKQGRTVLDVAVTTGNFKMVKWILKNGGNPNLNDGSLSALSQACIDDQFKIAAILLKYGADPNFKSFLHTTPVVDAIESAGDEKLALLLINHGADITVRTDMGETLLHLAVANRMNTLALSLLKRKADVNAEDNIGWTALFEPTDFKTALLLLENGADPNHQSHDGSTPLMWAATRGNETMIRLLLNHGANPDIKNQKGQRAVDIAAQKKEFRIVGLLNSGKIPANMKETGRMLERAGTTALGKSSTICYLGLKPGEQIGLAAEKGDVSALKEFLSDKSRINNVCWNHMTPLQIASIHGQEKTVRWLLRNGANPAIRISSEIDVPFLEGMDALALTLFSRDEDIAQLLIQAGAPLDRKYQGGNPLISGFCAQGMPKVVNALIQRGADVNQSLPDGTTPLMLAAKGGHLKTVRLLLENGANPFKTIQSGSMKGKTAMDLAKELGYKKIVALLSATMNRLQQGKLKQRGS